MPKKPKHITPVRQVRQSSGLSQKEFANLLAINLHLYHSLELGRAAVTDENAYRIFEHTGAVPSTLDHRRNAIARAADGSPYSEKAWKAWRRYVAKDLHWAQTKELLNWTHFLCDVGRQRGRLRVVQRAVANALRAAASQCDLVPAINQELGKIRLKTNLPFTYGVLRSNKSLAKAVGFKEPSSRNRQIIDDDAVWKGTVTRSVRWDPFGACPSELIKRLEPLCSP